MGVGTVKNVGVKIVGPAEICVVVLKTKGEEGCKTVRNKGRNVLERFKGYQREQYKKWTFRHE